MKASSLFVASILGLIAPFDQALAFKGQSCGGERHTFCGLNYDDFCKIAGDINGDGSADLLFVGGTHAFTHVADGAEGIDCRTTRKETQFVEINGAYEGCDITMRDADNDNRADLVVKCGSNTFTHRGHADGTIDRFAQRCTPQGCP